MTSLSYTLPTVGDLSSTEDPEIRTALADIKSAYNTDHAAGAHSLSWLASGTSAQIIVCNASGVPTYVAPTNATISNTGVITNVTDAALASPNNSIYKTLISARVLTSSDMASGTYLLSTATPGTAGAVGNNFVLGPTVGNVGTTVDGSGDLLVAPPILYLDNADYDVAGLSTKLRVRAQVLTNGTAWSSVTATFGLYPITTSGSADNLGISLGTVVAGSTAAIANPAANSPSSAVGTDFTFPSDGVYGLGMALSATLTNNAAAVLLAQLQVRNTT